MGGARGEGLDGGRASSRKGRRALGPGAALPLFPPFHLVVALALSLLNGRLLPSGPSELASEQEKKGASSSKRVALKKKGRGRRGGRKEGREGGGRSGA